MKKLIITPNGEEIVDLTSEEVAQREKDTTNDNLYEQEKTNHTNARTSAINKLKGATYSALTDAEAKALFGE
jgi:hypothetical protein